MKTSNKAFKKIAINLYRFDQLTESAQNKALQDWRESYEFFDMYDITKDIQYLVSLFNCNLDDYSLSYDGYGQSNWRISVKYPYDSIDDILTDLATYEKDPKINYWHYRMLFFETFGKELKQHVNSFDDHETIKECIEAGIFAILESTEQEIEYQNSKEYFETEYLDHCLDNCFLESGQHIHYSGINDFEELEET